MSFDWKKLLAQVAPVLGTALGGPFGALAGTAVRAVLGLPEDSDDEALAKSLARATPEQLAAIKEADARFRENMRRLDVDILKLDAADRSSARRRESALRDNVPGCLALGVTGGFFGLLGWMMLSAPPSGSEKVLDIMTGALGAAWASIVSYYFGSSAGSASLRETLRQAVGGK